MQDEASSEVYAALNGLLDSCIVGCAQKDFDHSEESLPKQELLAQAFMMMCPAYLRLCAADKASVIQSRDTV